MPGGGGARSPTRRSRRWPRRWARSRPEPRRRPLDPVRLVRGGDALDAPGELTLEDGSDLGTIERLPLDLPLGYHRLATDAGEQLLIAAPPHCHLPEELRTWGWSVQLATTRSRRQLGDRRPRRPAGAGRLVGRERRRHAPGEPARSSHAGPAAGGEPLLPVHASLPQPAAPGGRADPRRGADRATSWLRWPRPDEALNAERLVDRDRVQALKLRGAGAPLGERRRRRRGGAAWRRRPAAGARRLASQLGGLRGHRRASRAGIGAAGPTTCATPTDRALPAWPDELAERVAFHEWVQWLLDEQLRRGRQPGSGARPGPPDRLRPRRLRRLVLAGRSSPRARGWGRHPTCSGPTGRTGASRRSFRIASRAAGYRPYIETLRAGLRHAGGLRIDHAAGLFRGWWVPAGRGSAEGAYVRYRSDELLRSSPSRACAPEPGSSARTSARSRRGSARRSPSGGSCRCGSSTSRTEPPASFPRRAMALLSTHDLPTAGRGLERLGPRPTRQRAGVVPDPAALAALRGRLEAVTGLRPGAEPRQVILAAHAALCGGAIGGHHRHARGCAGASRSG